MLLLDTVLPFVGVLVGLILIHEAGHYVTAKLAGVRVEEFGVGFPPRAKGKRIGETIYSINWLPLGGFVKLTGEESSRVFIADINRHGAADAAGLRARDVITAVAGEPVHNETELAAVLAAEAHSGVITLTIEREVTTGNGIALEAFEYDLEVVPGRSEAEAADADADDRADADAPESAQATIGRIAGVQVGADPRSFGSRAPLTRIGILAAGALVNLALPILLFAIAAIIPQDRAAGPAVVTSVVRGGPADMAGFEAGDRVLSVDGVETENRGDVGLQIRLNLNENIEVVLERDTVAESTTQQPAVASTETIVTHLKPRLAPPTLLHTVQEGETVHDVGEILGVNASQVLDGAGFGGGVELDEGLVLALPGETYVVQEGDTAFSVARDFGLRQQTVLDAASIDLINLEPGLRVAVPQGPTGITIANGSFTVVKDGEGVFGAFSTGFERTRDTFILSYNAIRSWLAGGEELQVNGPIGLAQGTGEVVRDAGWIRLIELAALISISLGIMNLLPIPGLDGGRIVFVLIEILRRGKRISPEKEGLVHLTGFALLITAAIVIGYFDVVRVIDGESVLR
ncbi:MAG: Membrane-associated protease RseP, regulator of RpoE activity [Chloroflexi bacterium]|nr:MAG: Membrane-associated protease RseP, regulator of RpoE activity [Chloroflexota bacterium]